TPHIATARRLALVWGLEPRICADPKGLDDMTEQAVAFAVRLGLARPTERILILAGSPFGVAGSANILRLAHTPAVR
ncbi:MAG: pyruvate kinase alpha/beta domain-containing protein, partial [Caulobacteraceae bacterium]